MSIGKKTFSGPAGIRGVGLIEVLIAVLVMAVGMLGIAAMQATALRNSQSALERSQAVVQTYSIIDAMRANRDSALANEYVMAMTCTAPAAGATLATKDKNTWITSLKADHNLGATACGRITRNGDIFSITVQWDDSRGGTQGATGDADQIVTTQTRI